MKPTHIRFYNLVLPIPSKAFEGSRRGVQEAFHIIHKINLDYLEDDIKPDSLATENFPILSTYKYGKGQ